MFFKIFAKREFSALQMRVKDYLASVGVDSLLNDLRHPLLAVLTFRQSQIRDSADLRYGYAHFLWSHNYLPYVTFRSS